MAEKYFWIDGICNDCGCLVIESSSTTKYNDYMNSCTNPNCENYGWHHIADNEFLKYYIHGFDIKTIKNIKPKRKIKKLNTIFQYDNNNKIINYWQHVIIIDKGIDWVSFRDNNGKMKVISNCKYTVEPCNF